MAHMVAVSPPPARAQHEKSIAACESECDEPGVSALRQLASCFRPQGEELVVQTGTSASTVALHLLYFGGGWCFCWALFVPVLSCGRLIISFIVMGLQDDYCADGAIDPEHDPLCTNLLAVSSRTWLAAGAEVMLEVEMFVNAIVWLPGLSAA